MRQLADRDWKGSEARIAHVNYSFQYICGKRIKNCVNDERGVTIGGRKIKCIQFAEDIVLSENETN